MSAPRSFWTGSLTLSLINVPVKAYSTKEVGEGKIKLNLLHNDPNCMQRIRKPNVCPQHGKLTSDEVVRAYKFDKDKYVTITDKELADIRSPAEKRLNIASFAPQTAFDLGLLDGDHYVLAPDGPVAERPYDLLYRAMVAKKRWAVAECVMSHRDKLLLIRPLDGYLTASTMYYATEVRQVPDLLGPRAGQTASDAEVSLASQLVDAASHGFKFGEFVSHYDDRLAKLIDLKTSGQEIVAASVEHERAQVLSLMETLQAAVAQQQQRAPDPMGRERRTVSALVSIQGE
jgi:DNA end-binding protein Ku